MSGIATQPISFDKLWKSIIEDLFGSFMLYFFSKYAHLYDLSQPIVFLDTELAKLQPDSETKNRLADKLVRLVAKNGQEVWLYIHIEVQGYPDKHFNERMFTMKCRLREKYGKNVAAIAILTDPYNNFRPGHYEEITLGGKTTYSYTTFKLKDHEPEALLQGNNPFGIILQTAWYHIFGSTQDEAILATKRSLIKRLLASGLPKKQVDSILQFIVYYTKFENTESHHRLSAFVDDQLNTSKHMGIKELVATHFQKIGREEGLKEGKEEGRVEGKDERNIEIANAMLADGEPMDKIMRYTGLSREAIGQLR